MSIRLITSDLDGTLLTDEKTLPEENLRAIRDAIQAGAEFVPATGRPIYNLFVDVFRELRVNYVISANGSCIHRLSDGQCIHRELPDPEDVLELVREFRQERVYLRVFTEDAICMERCRVDLADALGLDPHVTAALKESCRVVDNLEEYLKTTGTAVSKLAMYFVPQPDGSYLAYDRILRRIEEDPRFDQVCGGYHNMEITRSGVSKGTALTWLANFLGIPIAETMACGDTENDVAMLRCAGIGVAMAEAEQRAKDAADFISTSNNDSGVAFAIRKFLKL